MTAPEAGQVWRATSDMPNRQTAHYLTLELLEISTSGTIVPHWHCLCLDNGNVGLTSLALGDSAVAWERIA